MKEKRKSAKKHTWGALLVMNQYVRIVGRMGMIMYYINRTR